LTKIRILELGEGLNNKITILGVIRVILSSSHQRTQLTVTAK